MKTPYTIATILAISVLSFVGGRVSKQCPQPDPIIRYIETNNQIKNIQNEIDSIDVLIRTDVVTMPRSVRDSIRALHNPR
jgi:hypothetical protein